MFPCPIKENCTSFNTIKLLLEHIRDNHNPWSLKNIKCTFCENRYTFDSFRKHIKKHEDHSTDAVISEFDDCGNMEEGDNIQDLNDKNVFFEKNEVRGEEEIQLPPMEEMNAAAKRFGEGMLENVNNLETVNSVAETLPSQNVFTNQTKSQFLSELYYSNQEFMEKAFEEITRNETFDFHGDNIIERFSIPKNIACLVLLKKQQLMEYDVRINKIVREVCQSILVDAVAAVKQRTKLPNNATEPLLDFMFKLTQNDFFKIINKEDGPILQACRKRKQRKDKNNGVASQKKSKLSFPVTNIED